MPSECDSLVLDITVVISNTNYRFPVTYKFINPQLRHNDFGTMKGMCGLKLFREKSADQATDQAKPDDGCILFCDQRIRQAEHQTD